MTGAVQEAETLRRESRGMLEAAARQNEQAAYRYFTTLKDDIYVDDVDTLTRWVETVFEGRPLRSALQVMAYEVSLRNGRKEDGT